MKNQERSGNRTMLEYLVMLNEQSYSGIGRELKITPQQFSDWIKQRRPIPGERLTALAAYFKVPESMITDARQFAAFLTDDSRTRIHMLLVEREMERLTAENAEEEDIEPFREKKRKLERELENYQRLAKVSALLERPDDRAGAIVDALLEAFEKGREDEWLNKLER
ncbi:hypothetical protein [Saccharibacillus kuerlensis]|uniref:HTH cro/C1-type domain-containing protein n=1 Tax=Saccharibacillus kuerlensis TaxID=459527 RepID=A0ABQ2KZV2_9BACL|nr:hypothetical protein [Saccharibacillus kuerlensis]GGN97942.1 hypothetical protein GCM10010969_16370 [Saccharibacillus kuerlensis]